MVLKHRFKNRRTVGQMASKGNCRHFNNDHIVTSVVGSVLQRSSFVLVTSGFLTQCHTNLTQRTEQPDCFATSVSSTNYACVFRHCKHIGDKFGCLYPPFNQASRSLDSKVVVLSTGCTLRGFYAVLKPFLENCPTIYT